MAAANAWCDFLMELMNLDVAHYTSPTWPGVSRAGLVFHFFGRLPMVPAAEFTDSARRDARLTARSLQATFSAVARTGACGDFGGLHSWLAA
jgi:hypothetical protein